MLLRPTKLISCGRTGRHLRCRTFYPNPHSCPGRRWGHSPKSKISREEVSCLHKPTVEPPPQPTPTQAHARSQGCAACTPTTHRYHLRPTGAWRFLGQRHLLEETKVWVSWCSSSSSPLSGALLMVWEVPHPREPVFSFPGTHHNLTLQRHDFH